MKMIRRVVISVVFLLAVFGITVAQIDCGPLSAPENGDVTLTGTTSGSRATYSCNNGYTLSGNGLRFCRSTGRWTFSDPTCIPVDCGSLANPPNGMVDVPSTTFGSQATYSCDAGFMIENMNDTRMCQADATWSGSEPQCVDIDCGTLPSPMDGGVELTGTSVQSVAQYTCQSGFNLVGNEMRVCQGNGSWSGTEPECEQIDCGVLDTPDNGTIAYVSLGATTVGSFALYSCNEGFEELSAGVSLRQCLANGTWSGMTPICEAVDCGSLANPPNGIVDLSSTTFGSQATYSCDAGFTLENMDDTRMCQANATWSESEPQCAAVDCGSLMSPENGNVDLMNGTTFGSVAEYSCDSGFALSVGDRLRVCLETGEWSGNPPICERVECPLLIVPDNGSITYSPAGPLIVDTLAIYDCVDGFELVPDIAFRRCQENGEWSEEDATCEATVDCGVLTSPANGAVTFISTTLGSVANYSCILGYSLDEGSTRSCGVNGEWSGRDPECQINDCGPPSDIEENGGVLFENTTFGSVALYSCDEGYVLNPPGSSPRQCLANMSWEGMDPTCEPIRCTREVLTNPLNGQVTMTNDNVFESIATYNCSEGFIILGSRTRTCGSDGEWSGSAPECQEIMCPPLADPTNGKIVILESSGGLIATYTCDEGFSINSTDDSIRICQQNGIWSGNEPICTINDCGSPSDIEQNGEVMYQNTTFGSVALYSCVEGYVLNPPGSSLRQCLANMTWEGLDPTCEPIDCGSLDNPENGEVSTDMTILGSEADYSCNIGFQLEGVATRTCQSDGTWSDNPPTCEAIDCGVLLPPQNGIITLTSTLFASNATYECVELYELVGNSTRQCQHDGNWSGVAPTCQPDFSNCRICSRNADCVNVSEGLISCSCSGGYEGDGITCTNINECLQSPDICGRNSDCFDIDGGFGCNCRPGYTTSTSGQGCTNIIECEEDSNLCSPNAFCTDTEGSFECTCIEGFNGDGFSCEPMCNRMFQLLLAPVSNCENRQTNATMVDVMLVDITTSVMEGVNSICNQRTTCSLNEESITSAQLSCVSDNRPLYRASVNSFGNGCNEIISSVSEWIESGAASITVQGEILAVADNCEVEVESFDGTLVCSEPDTTTEEVTSDITQGPTTGGTDGSAESDNQETIIIGASAGAAGLLILLAVIILVIVACCYVSRRSQKRPSRYLDVQVTTTSNGRKFSADYVRANPYTNRPAYPTAKPPIRPTYSNIDNSPDDLQMSTFDPRSSVVPTLGRSYSSLSNTLHHVVENPGAREDVHLHTVTDPSPSATQV